MACRCHRSSLTHNTTRWSCWFLFSISQNTTQSLTPTVVLWFCFWWNKIGIQLQSAQQGFGLKVSLCSNSMVEGGCNMDFSHLGQEGCAVHSSWSTRTQNPWGLPGKNDILTADFLLHQWLNKEMTNDRNVFCKIKWVINFGLIELDLYPWKL